MSFCGIFLAYVIYAQLAVPFLIPENNDTPVVSFGGGGDAPVYRTPEADPYLKYVFPDENAWERNSANKLMIDENVCILFHEHVITDNKIIVKPCTAMFLPSDSGLSQEEQYKRAFVIQANEYAELRFSEQINLTAMKSDSFEGGEMVGQVTMFQRASAPGANDDFELFTRNIHFNKTQVKTSYPIDFRFGKSSGGGENLLVMLDPPGPGRSDSDYSIKSIELHKLSFLNIVIPEDEQKTEKTAEDAQGVAVSFKSAGSNDTKISVVCGGRVDFLPLGKLKSRWAARFMDQVKVTRESPDGSTDHLGCKEMHIEFGMVADEKDAKKTLPDENASRLMAFTKLQPLRLIAYGDPRKIVTDPKTGKPVSQEEHRTLSKVTISSPKNAGFMAEGIKLIYDFGTEEIVLSNWMRNDEKHYQGTLPDAISISFSGGEQKYTINGHDLHYKMGEKGEFGRLQMSGAGSLFGFEGPPENRKAIMSARWQEQLVISPDLNDPNQLLLQLQKANYLEIPDFGKMTASNVALWCDKLKKESTESGGDVFSGGASYIPQRALIFDNQQVIFSAKDGQGTCKVNQFWIYFTPKSSLYIDENGRPIAPPGNAVSSEFNERYASSVKPEELPKGEEKTPKTMKSLLGTNNGGSDSTFRIDADIMKASVVIGEQNKMELDLLKLEGNKEKGIAVEIEEISLKEPIADPIHILAEEVRIEKPASTSTEIHIFGENAEFKGHGAQFNGTNVNVFRETNTMTSNGPGRLKINVPPNTDLAALSFSGKFDKNSPKPRSSMDDYITIDWTGGMAFNGRQVLFEKEVKAKYQVQEIRCEVLSLFLKNRIMFFEKNEKEAEPESVEASGNVFVENHRFDGRFQTEFNRAENLNKIAINLITGDIVSNGSGSLKSTFRGDGKTKVPNLAGGGSDEKDKKSEKELTYAEIRFHKGIKGNFKNREGTIFGQVGTIVKPVYRFDEHVDREDIRGILQDGFILECDQMAVSQTILPGDTNGGLQLTASGSTTIDGGIYRIIADKAKYDQSKDLMIIEGDGTVDAEIYRQEFPGGPTDRFPAQRIEFNPKTNKIISSGVRSGGIRFVD